MARLLVPQCVSETKSQTKQKFQMLVNLYNLLIATKPNFAEHTQLDILYPMIPITITFVLYTKLHVLTTSSGPVLQDTGMNFLFIHYPY